MDNVIQMPRMAIRDSEPHVKRARKVFGDDYTKYVSYVSQWTMKNGAKIHPWSYEEYMLCEPEA